MINRKQMLTLIPNLLSLPYELGVIDCLQILMMFYPNLIPDEFEGIDIKNKGYVQIWQEDRQNALNKLFLLVETYFDKVEDKKTIVEGNLCVISNVSINIPTEGTTTDTIAFLVGIYLGGNNCLFALEDEGIKIKTIDIENENVSFYKEKE